MDYIEFGVYMIKNKTLLLVIIVCCSVFAQSSEEKASCKSAVVKKTKKTTNHSKEYTCTHPGCFKKFSSPSSMHKHRQREHEKVRFACPVEDCKSTFSDESNLNRHIRKSHVESEKRPFQCIHCEWAFKEKHQLERHMAIHSDKRSYQCSHCGQRLKGKHYVQYHDQCHKQGKPCPRVEKKLSKPRTSKGISAFLARKKLVKDVAEVTDSQVIEDRLEEAADYPAAPAVVVATSEPDPDKENTHDAISGLLALSRQK